MTNTSLALFLTGILLAINVFLFAAAATPELWHSALISDVQLVVTALALFYLLRDRH